MTDIFKIIEYDGREEVSEKGICIGIEVKIADQKVSLPLCKVCKTYEELAVEAGRIQDSLKLILEISKGLLTGSTLEGGLKFTPEMSPEDIWAILSKVEDEEIFIKSFNKLDDAKRRDVAEHVLTRCNIFSGNASIFSGRYDSISGYIK